MRNVIELADGKKMYAWTWSDSIPYFICKAEKREDLKIELVIYRMLNWNQWANQFEAICFGSLPLMMIYF